MNFKTAFTQLASVFSGLTLCMYAYVWTEYPDIIEFLNHLFPYQALVVAAHAFCAFLATLKPIHQVASNYHDPDDEEFEWINPGTGAPMLNGMGGVDAMGYPFGSGPDDDHT